MIKLYLIQIIKCVYIRIYTYVFSVCIYMYIFVKWDGVKVWFQRQSWSLGFLGSRVLFKCSFGRVRRVWGIWMGIGGFRVEIRGGYFRWFFSGIRGVRCFFEFVLVFFRFVQVGLVLSVFWDSFRFVLVYFGVFSIVFAVFFQRRLGFWGYFVVFSVCCIGFLEM